MSEVNELFQEFERGSDAIKEKLAKSFYELGKETGIKKEQERIIELLENEKFSLPEGIDEGTTYLPIQEAIALIRGEK